jgi:hypothetical protein
MRLALSAFMAFMAFIASYDWKGDHLPFHGFHGFLGKIVGGVGVRGAGGPFWYIRAVWQASGGAFVCVRILIVPVFIG